VPALNWQRWIQVFRSPALVLLTATTGLNSVGNMLVFSYLAPITKALFGLGGSGLASLYFVNGLGGLAGNLLTVPMVARHGAGWAALTAGLLIALTFVMWPVCAWSLPLIFILQLIWSLGAGGFPSAQQTRLVMVDPSLASATIAMNSSIGYLGTSLGTTLGATAWTLVGPRYMTWIGALFVLASLTCSMVGERAARRHLSR
jgi:predicted MFS family arabinose efflux permease